MPRKSAAASLVEQVTVEPMRPDAPYDLNDEEAAVWRQIVATLPPKYFGGFQHDYLGLLCRHIVEARYVKAQLDLERAKKKPNPKTASEWKRQWMQETTTINALMRAMRLTQMSVYHPTTAGRHIEAEKGAADTVWEKNIVGADAEEAEAES